MTQLANPMKLRKASHEVATEPRHGANPYVGPRPFTIDEKDRFFGREQEASQLIPLTIAEHLVLFYAQSGAGKSSLINARLIPGLEERNFKVLTGRVSGQSAEGEQADNIFTYNLLLSCERNAERKQEEVELNLSHLAHMTLAEYLADLDIEAPAAPGYGFAETGAAETGQIAETQKIFVDAPQTIGGVQPLALIIDQFEEIITTNPGAWSQRGPFFQQLCEAMEADPYLWVVLAIREDYIAALDPYADLLPGKLRARFYMQRMGYEAGLDAVRLPVQDIRAFDSEAAEELVKNLSLINIGKDQNNNPIYQPGQYIEPVQLQVVCYQLWEELRTRPGESITIDDLLNLAKGKDLAQFISTALANYYVESVHEMIRKFPEISERRLREWFSRELITETETRGAVRQGRNTTGSTSDALPNVVVRMLQDRFIIRAEIRGGNTWYELSHDRFVAPILQSNREWLEKNSRPVEQAAQAYFAGDPQANASLLYEGRQLQEALNLLRDHPDDISEKAQKFIQLSREAAEKRQKRRRRSLYVVYALLLVVLMGLTIFSIDQSNRATANAAQARQQKYTAEAAGQLADLQRLTAVAAENLAYNQRNLAETASAQEAVQRKTAEAANSQAQVAQKQAEQDRDTAIKSEGEARKAQNQAQGARLSSLSDFFSETQIDLSLLLAIQSVKISGTWDTYRALLSGIQHGLENQASRAGFPWHVESNPYGVAISPDGTMLAVGSLRNIDLWYIQGHAPVMKLPATFVAEYSMDTVSFDPTSTLLARGGGDGKVRILNLKTGKMTEFHPFQYAANSYAFNSVLAVAFQPKGDLLAVGTDRDPVSKKGLLFLYNYKTDKIEWSGSCRIYSCSVVAWSPDGSKLAVGSKDGSLQIIDAVNKRILLDNRFHKADITGLAWYPDGQRLISVGVDQQMIQLDTKNQKILKQSGSRKNPIFLSLALSPDGRFILAGVNDKTGWVGLWDAESLEKLSQYKLSGHFQPVSAVSFNQQGNMFVTASHDNAILLWKFEPVDPLGKPLLNLKSGKVEGVFLDGQNKLNFLRAVGDTSAETINEDAVKQLANPADKPASTAFKLNAAHASMVTAAMDGKPVYVLGGTDGLVSFVDPGSGRETRKALKVAIGSLRSLAVSLDGKLLAAAACTSPQSCSEVSLWSLASDRPGALMKTDFSSLNIGIVTSIAISPDNNTLALGNDAGQIFFYDINTGKTSQAVTEGLSLKNVNLVVTSLAFSPQANNLLAAGFHDGRVALWQASSQGPIGEFTERMSGEVSALLFRKDPGTGLLSLVSVSGPGEVREWSVDENTWVKRACQMAGRDLNAEEKAKFLLPGSPQVDYCK